MAIRPREFHPDQKQQPHLHNGHVPVREGARSVRPGRPHWIPPTRPGKNRHRSSGHITPLQTPGMRAAQFPPCPRGPGSQGFQQVILQPATLRLGRNLGQIVVDLGNPGKEAFNREKGTRSDEVDEWGPPKTLYASTFTPWPRQGTDREEAPHNLRRNYSPINIFTEQLNRHRLWTLTTLTRPVIRHSLPASLLSSGRP